MEQPVEEQVAAVGETKKTKPLNKRWFFAIPLAIIGIAIGVSIYTPGFFLGGMMTDSCSGGNSYIMWEIWLGYLWPAVMLAAALFPPFLLVKNKSWKKVLIAMAVGLAASVVWYILWIPVLSISGC
ncbi:MAG: hypothetical protein AB9891_05710 [Anaerolineaceae bacterium]